ncbi:MAG TPA: DUF2231 domain-containing protein [Patescibacteria group bacterium]|nr:DUF2231 domain-containing protein [Patescibacteria group bacterium]
MNSVDLHPVLVHFPVALLTVYAVVELARFRALTSRPSRVELKGALAVFGFLGSVAAFLAGTVRKEALESVGAVDRLIETHSTFALATVVVAGVIAAAHAMRLLKGPLLKAAPSSAWARAPIMVADALLSPVPSALLALLVLALVTVTGGLGGAIVYGPDVDPFVRTITALLGLR